MKALVYHGRNDVRYQTFPEAEVKANDVRLRVKYAGICHTDFNEYLHGPLFVAQVPHLRTGRSIPIVMGHEFSGEVVEVGHLVRKIRVGDPVAVNAVDSCRQCDYCRRGLIAMCPSVAYIGFARDGGFAEYAVVPETCCYRLSGELSFQEGALVEPLAVALHAVKQARVTIGSRVAIVGGGAVGLCVLQALRATGARGVFVIDNAEAKKELALALGASAFINSSDSEAQRDIYELTDGVGVDAAFECAGSAAAMRTAVGVTRGGGLVCLVGILPGPCEFDFNLLLKQEKSVLTSLAYSDEFPTVIAMLGDGRLKAEPLITRTVSLSEALEKGLARFEEFAATNIRTLIKVEV